MKNTISERIFDFLKDFPPFDLLERDQLYKIAANVFVTYIEENIFIFKQGENPHKYFYIVKDGAVGLFRNLDKGKILIDICDEGDIFGLRPLIQNDQYLSSAKSKEETLLYSIPVKILKEIIESNTKVQKFIIASFSSNIKTPYEKNNSEQLFANIEYNNSYVTDIQTVECSKNPITCIKTTTIKEAAQIMSKKHVGSILIVENKNPIGIITDKDLRLKIATGIVSIDKEVTEIMSSPVITFPEKISTAEAQIAMLKHRITHLCITKDGTSNSELIGIMSEHDIVVLQGNSPSALIKEIKRAKNANSLKNIREKAYDLLVGYIEQNTPITFVSKIISSITEVITKKIIELSIGEMECKPKVKFAWLALGSQGRNEQLLVTDQDNALVFEVVLKEDYKNIKDYFLRLSKKINDKLNIVGFEYCPAEMMASNPKWCMSISEWKSQFNQWISQPTEKSVLMCTIFFDYALIYGDKRLTNQLSKNIFKSVENCEMFLNFLGKYAIKNPSPLGFFRQFLLEQDGEYKDRFDIKGRALMPLIDGARLLILHQNIQDKNNTIERFEKLAINEKQNKDLYLSCIDSFEILLRFRTIQGIKHNNSGRYVDLNVLNKSEKLKLKGCFKSIKDLQELIYIRFKLSQIML